MLEYLKYLNVYDYLYAAVAAFVITNLITKLSRIFLLNSKKTDNILGKVENRTAVVEKCASMFPIDTVFFGGRIFNRGMMVKVTTVQKKIIEGELIGRNNMNILCIITKQSIVAHELDKIEDISSI